MFLGVFSSGVTSYAQAIAGMAPVRAMAFSAIFVFTGPLPESCGHDGFVSILQVAKVYKFFMLGF